MIDILRTLKQQSARFEQEAVDILARYESAGGARVMTLDQTRKLLGGLSLQQDELFQQALVCVERGVYRAAHVMAWAAFADFLEHKLAADGLVKVHAARPAWAKYTTVEELREHVPEHQLIEVAQVVGLLTKGEMKTLHGHLSKRNECAHPSPYKPGLNESLGYVAELIDRISHLQSRPL